MDKGKVKDNKWKLRAMRRVQKAVDVRWDFDYKTGEFRDLKYGGKMTPACLTAFIYDFIEPDS